MLKKILLFPITLLSIILMSIGSLCIGYSFVTIVFNDNYIEMEVEVVKKEDANGNEKEVLEYIVDGQTFQSSLFPFLRLKEGTKVVIGYNPENPTWFHLGDRNFHFAMFLWGSFFMILGLVILFSMRGLKRI